MTTVGVATGAGRGMGLACAQLLTSMVDVVVMVDRDEATVSASAQELAAGAATEPFVADVTDRDRLARLADRVSEHGSLRAVAHAAGISPTMADWRGIFTIDLVGTALLADALRPVSSEGTATVCFASMAALLGDTQNNPAADAALDEPLDERLLDRIHAAVGPAVEDSGIAYSWAKRGVLRFVKHEAVRLGAIGARICSVSPGLIDTPQGQQEAEAHPSIGQMLERTPLRRLGRAEEVAAVVAFLLSDQASFVNGVDVLVDGGVFAALQTAATPA